MTEKIVKGKVIHGNKMGRKIGFPTANLELNSRREVKLKPGIYTAMCFLPNLPQSGLGIHTNLDKEDYLATLANPVQPLPNSKNSFPYPGLLHYGSRSTFNDQEFYWEVYLLDFDYDIYDQEMVVHVGEFIRPSKKFVDVETLVAEINQDVEQARKILFK
jgi:riboflavin kinase / FMN adenylyltransferase